MGMYDHLYIVKELLPLSDEEKELITDQTVWRTKSLECVLTEVYIGSDRQLKINHWVYESVPKEERPYPDAKGWKSVIGSIRRTDEKILDSNYTGEIVFYTKVNDQWLEFISLFNEGKMILIKRVKEVDGKQQ